MLNRIKWAKPVLWLNPEYFNLPNDMMLKHDISKEISHNGILNAEERLNKFASFFALEFSELKDSNGIIESRLIETKRFSKELCRRTNVDIRGRIFVKCDHELPVAGSIKARGGFYEVLKTAEKITMKSGILKAGDDYSIFNQKNTKEYLSQFQISVGSTGNLGLSTGIMGSRMGFKVTVHMSENSKHWKKKILHQNGVRVKEYKNDYSYAVEKGREEAALNDNCHFIDDERSKDLFYGYAVGASRLAEQLKKQGVPVDREHPLFVYLPCGVGGAPSGITYGLKKIYGTNVHCFFAEPVQSPSMLLGLITGKYNRICVSDIGLNNNTIADGLAVGRPSGFASQAIEPYIGGLYTVTDRELSMSQAMLYLAENIYVEPSAAAGAKGPLNIFGSEKGLQFLDRNELTDVMDNSTHVIWSTGGSLVPSNIRVNELESSMLTLMK